MIDFKEMLYYQADGSSKPRQVQRYKYTKRERPPENHRFTDI